MKTNVKESRLRELEKFANFKGIFCDLDMMDADEDEKEYQERLKAEIKEFYNVLGFVGKPLNDDEVEIIRIALNTAFNTGEPDLILYNIKE